MSHVDETTPAKHPFISNKVYDLLKFITTIVAPAAGAAYFGLAAIWGFPFGEQIVGTIAIIETFIGAVLLISAARYASSGAKYDGSLEVDPEAGVGRLQVEGMTAVTEKDTLTLKVTQPTPVQE